MSSRAYTDRIDERAGGVCVVTGVRARARADAPIELIQGGYMLLVANGQATPLEGRLGACRVSEGAIGAALGSAVSAPWLDTAR